MPKLTVSAEGRASLKMSPLPHTKKAGWAALHVARVNAMEAEAAVPVNWQVIPVATLVDVAVKVAPDCCTLKS